MNETARRSTTYVAMLAAAFVAAAACGSTSGNRAVAGLDQPGVVRAPAERWTFARQRELVDKLCFDTCLAAGAERQSGERLLELDSRAASAEAVVTDDALRSRLQTRVVAVLEELRRRDEVSARR
jgi:hypothetical protein